MVNNKFLAAFEAGTQPHPLLRYQRVWGNVVCFEVSLWDGKVWLDFIQSIYRGQGDASEALKWLCALADEHGVTLHGHVKRVGHTGLKNSELRSWYTRHGFKIKRSGDAVREPQ